MATATKYVPEYVPPAWMIEALRREREAAERERDARRPRVYVELPVPEFERRPAK